MKNEEKTPYSEEKQIFLNMAVPGTAFVITAIVLLIILNAVNGGLPRSMPMFDLILVMLASFRMIRGATYDKLLRYVREHFQYEKHMVMENGNRMIIKRERRAGWKRAISETLSCPWCTGFWTTLIILFIYFISSATWIIILIFAVSGVATFLQLLTNLIATKYEHVKMENDKMEANAKMREE